MRARRQFLIILILWPASAFAGPNVAAPETTPYVACRDDAVEQGLRSAELKTIAEADQNDRPNNVLKPGAQARDRDRRERTGFIFGEGCFKSSQDFAAAAMVFQHGDEPEHFFQSYIWAKRAADLGDLAMRNLMTRAIDWYLVSTGHKELFASQFFKASLDAKVCWCIQQVEPSFTDELRLKYGGRSYKEEVETLQHMNGSSSCSQVECSLSLSPTPKGSVPGIW